MPYTPATPYFEPSQPTDFTVSGQAGPADRAQFATLLQVAALSAQIYATVGMAALEDTGARRRRRGSV